MHHKANSFHSQNLFPKSAVYAYGCWWVYSMKRKRTTKLSQTEVRPKGSETHMSVRRPDLRLVSVGITKCMVFRAEQLRDPRLPAWHVRRSREHSHVQLLQSRCSTEQNNLCCNNGTVKRFLWAESHVLLPLRCWKHMLGTSCRGLKCFRVHISGGEAGRVDLHRFKMATVLLANYKGGGVTRRFGLPRFNGNGK